jgi:methylenetetrahydrofolate dehydrogenase (NADP+)/methenyltetrahydrofolate cyclohydrolase
MNSKSRCTLPGKDISATKMSAVKMPGAPVAEVILNEVRAESASFVSSKKRPMGLGTILVGDDGPSARYVDMKRNKAKELGINSIHVHLPGDVTQSQFEEAIEELNEDESVDAMLVQYPVPPQLNYEKAISLMNPDKDVDGLHPFNMGRLALSLDGPKPCTPAGIERLLDYYGIDLSGRHVVIVGRGLTIGRPLSIMLSQKRKGANAIVTLVHTGTSDWASYTRSADILIAAAGSPYMIRPEHVKEGAVVVGAGVRYEGSKLLPDVDESVESVAGYITPRIGGVGPLTVAMLFKNLADAALKKF